MSCRVSCEHGAHVETGELSEEGKERRGGRGWGCARAVVLWGQRSFLALPLVLRAAERPRARASCVHCTRFLQSSMGDDVVGPLVRRLQAVLRATAALQAPAFQGARGT